MFRPIIHLNPSLESMPTSVKTHQPVYHHYLRLITRKKLNIREKGAKKIKRRNQQDNINKPNFFQKKRNDIETRQDFNAIKNVTAHVLFK